VLLTDFFFIFSLPTVTQLILGFLLAINDIFDSLSQIKTEFFMVFLDLIFRPIFSFPKPDFMLLLRQLKIVKIN